jgi:arginyl-tRNA synthetase
MKYSRTVLENGLRVLVIPMSSFESATVMVKVGAGSRYENRGNEAPGSGPAKLSGEDAFLLRVLNKFPEVVALSAEMFAPNIVCTYLFNLAQKFNLFYQKCKIIGSAEQNFRLMLTAGVGQVIKNGLCLLGIQAPEKM